METVRPKSRLISKLGYEHDTCTLHVWLRSGRYMQYVDISEDEYWLLLRAPSPGRYFVRYLAPLDNQAPRRIRWARLPLVVLLKLISPFRRH